MFQDSLESIILIQIEYSRWPYEDHKYPSAADSAEGLQCLIEKVFETRKCYIMNMNCKETQRMIISEKINAEFHANNPL